MSEHAKYVLITGATEGIGYELAKLFVKDSYNLIIVARSEKKLDERAAEFRKSGVEVIPIVKDLFETTAPFELYSEVKEKGISVEMLVNNAGQGAYGEFVDNELDRELDIIQLNINSTVVLTKYFLKEMVARGSGRIMNLASIAGKIPGPYQAVYHGTKAFIHSFTEAVREEVKDTGVTLTSLLPGATDTNFFKKADMENSKIVDSDLDDPSVVAKSGYEAFMKGDDMVVTGFMNKVTTTTSSIMPDRMAAKSMRKQQEPKEKEEKGK